jgi:DNA-binding XRE family transcriptional regulator
MKREHKITVGRYTLIGTYEAVELEDGTFAMSSADFGRLGLQAAIAVFKKAESINGDELRFARKTMGLRQPDLGALLDVATETVSRWETGADPIRRQTQLAVLLFLEYTQQYGSPVPLAPANDQTLPVRIVA